jgi:hypothetical protein
MALATLSMSEWLEDEDRVSCDSDSIAFHLKMRLSETGMPLRANAV